MDESAAVQMALDALESLKGIEFEVQQLGGLLRSHVEQLPELVQPAEPEAQALALDDSCDGGWTTVVTASEPLPDGWAVDMAHFGYMQVVLLVAVLVAVLLNVGVVLWLAFSAKLNR